MKGTVGTKMIGNIENTDPEIISTSRERRQPGSHTSEKRKKKQLKYHCSIHHFCAILYLNVEIIHHFQWSLAAKNSAHTATAVTCMHLH